MNNYFDINYWYLYSIPAGQGDCPPDACRKILPSKPWGENQHPQYNPEIQEWELKSKSEAKEVNI